MIDIIKKKWISQLSNLTLRRINISKASEIMTHDLTNVDVIGIDEVQFLTMKFVSIVEKLSADGHRVIVAGLDVWILGRTVQIITIDGCQWTK